MKLSTIAFATVAAAGSGAYGLLEKRVVGGSSASSGGYSFVANIVVGSSDRSAGACTGALISPTVVVTSAGCVADSVSNKAVSVNTVIVGQGSANSVLGNSTVSLSEAVAKNKYVFAKEIHVHPGYNSIAHTDNIAVVVLTQPLASADQAAKVISKPGSAAKTAYTAVGWGSTAAQAGGDNYPSAGPFAAQLQQVQLGVGSKSACSDIWDSYANLTNSLCLTPVKSSANVCNGDGLLVKTASDKSVAIAGLLNIVGDSDDLPAETCTSSSAADFFTTFTNYIGWITQVTSLKESDFVSRATFTYDAVSDDEGDAEGSLADDEDEHSGSHSSDDDDESSLDAEESSDTSAASAVLGLASSSLAAMLIASLF
ncbi:hypothetical protein LPJ56_000837 [Coemansia sp. RSA 2599]|nr:hypothetical protein LPJ75_000460 [Coemansia sp. RSA 2598]KAJ1828848.1 hypothetical protein LPJ56_000837 [Coemansia sp. RSA 2599]